MKVKVAELEGRMLDRAVAKAEGLEEFDYPEESALWVFRPGNGLYGEPDRYEPSSDWSIGGPIIERERIGAYQNDAGDWCALPKGWLSDPERKPPFVRGPTPLVAAMRAYVSSKFGDVIEL